MRTGLRMRRSNTAQLEFRVQIRHWQTDRRQQQPLNGADGRKSRLMQFHTFPVEQRCDQPDFTEKEERLGGFHPARRAN